MVVDFEFKRIPGATVASLLYVGPWRENHLRKEFLQLVAWARKNKVRTGRWFFLELDGPNSRKPDRLRRWEAALEIKGTAKPAGRIRIKKLPAETVARVLFDPDEVSPRVIYHGLTDWLSWRKKSGEVTRVGSTREMYEGDPWTNPWAWSRAQVQVLVEKK
ncbi:MAG: GyrI-like domain-containing protein [Methanobacteriota archaeon]|nr:MAG: GyrI-like domain-containing protein [Euryarchaeota archaeon]